MKRKNPVAERIAQTAETYRQQLVSQNVDILRHTLSSAIALNRESAAKANQRAFKYHQAVYTCLENLVRLCEEKGVEGPEVDQAVALLTEYTMAPPKELTK